MKKILHFLLTGVILCATSCAQFTDIQPKGKNLLSTTDELELLLNREFYQSGSDFNQMAGDMLYTFSNVSTQLSMPNKTRGVIMWTWDESNQDKMAELTSNDSDYSEFYSIIGRVANPVIAKVDEASGSESNKKQLKAEALVLRAYNHYLAVNKFAKAYNPATADSDGGIPYMMHDWDISQPSEQATVQQVYDNILADVDAALALNALPDVSINKMRISKPAAYAVKAWVLMSMQKYDEAVAAARSVLAINDAIANYNEMIIMVQGYLLGGQYPAVLRPQMKCEEDLFYVHNLEFFNARTPESEARFEPGHASLDKMSSDKMMYDFFPGMGMGMSYLGLDYAFTYDLDSGWNHMGLKTTHMYLILAEAEIHKGNINAAMEIIDKIRVNRIDPSVYEPLVGKVTSKEDAIFRLKQTSHGENNYSCYNFIQRKRWNQIPGWEEDFTRDLAGHKFTLRHDSPMWIFPFPRNVINNNPNIKQNYK